MSPKMVVLLESDRPQPPARPGRKPEPRLLLFAVPPLPACDILDRTPVPGPFEVTVTEGFWWPEPGDEGPPRAVLTWIAAASREPA